MREPRASIRNIAELPWDELPGHHGGALPRLLAHPETTGARHIDHRISAYQPRAHVAPHAHTVQEQDHDAPEGEGLMEIEAGRRVVRRHDAIFIPPGVRHAMHDTGLTDLVFLVVTSPVRDE